MSFFLIFISSLFLSFLLVVFKQEKERERERTNFLLFLRTQKEKKYVFCLRSKSRAEARYKNRSSKQKTNALCVSSSWAFSSLHLKPLWHFYSRARNIFYYGSFLSSFLVLSDSFFLFSSCKKTEEGVSRFGLSRKQEEKEEEKKKFFFQRCFLSSLFFSLFYSLFSLRAREHLSSNLLPSYFNNAP